MATRDANPSLHRLLSWQPAPEIAVWRFFAVKLDVEPLAREVFHLRGREIECSADRAARARRERLRSNTAGPRIPFGARCSFANVAGDASPSNVPAMVSFVPVSVAVTDPTPVTVGDAAATGTGDSRPL